MKVAESRITSQGQISVPAEVRRRLGLGPGSIIEWAMEGSVIYVRRAGRCTSQEIHDALFPRKPEPHSLDELKDGIRRHARARHARR